MDEQEKLALANLKKKQGYELKLWENWDVGGRTPDLLRPLLDSMRPLLKSQAERYKSGSLIPPAAVDAEFQKQFISAVRTYDPGRGAALGTHVFNHLRKAGRFLKQNRQLGYMPEHRIDKIVSFSTTRTELEESLGRPPNTQELSEQLQWHPKEVSRMEKELRAENWASGYEQDPLSVMPSREREVLNLIRYELGPEELAVYEYTLGVNGKPEMQPGEIARTLKMTPSKVARLKSSIAEKVKKYYG